MDPNGSGIGPRHIGVIDVLVVTNPMYGPDDTVTSPETLDNIVRDALGLQPNLGFFLNILRPAPGTCVLGANVNHSNRPDLYIMIHTPTGISTYNANQQWQALAVALQRWIPLGEHTIVARINHGRGVLFTRDQDHPREA